MQMGKGEQASVHEFRTVALETLVSVLVTAELSFK